MLPLTEHFVVLTIPQEQPPVVVYTGVTMVRGRNRVGLHVLLGEEVVAFCGTGAGEGGHCL